MTSKQSEKIQKRGVSWPFIQAFLDSFFVLAHYKSTEGTIRHLVSILFCQTPSSFKSREKKLKGRKVKKSNFQLRVIHFILACFLFFLIFFFFQFWHIINLQGSQREEPKYTSFSFKSNHKK